MATQADVRRIALALPGVEEASDHFAFSVPGKPKPKGIAWVWKERVEPKKPRVPNPKFLAVRVANLAEKDLIIATEPAKYFTEPHYNGFPAVLVRLEAVTVADLRPLLEEAWRCLAPASLVRESAGKASTRSPSRAASGAATPAASRPASKSTSRTEAAMKKKGARDIPDFSKSRSPKGGPSAQDPAARKSTPAPTTRQAAKPQATSSKSGRRGS